MWAGRRTGKGKRSTRPGRENQADPVERSSSRNRYGPDPRISIQALRPVNRRNREAGHTTAPDRMHQAVRKMLASTGASTHGIIAAPEPQEPDASAGPATARSTIARKSPSPSAVSMRSATATRLVGAVLLEQYDEWAVSRQQMALEFIVSLSDNPTIKLPAVVPERPGPRRTPRPTPGFFTTNRDTTDDEAWLVGGQDETGFNTRQWIWRSICPCEVGVPSYGGPVSRWSFASCSRPCRPKPKKSG